MNIDIENNIVAKVLEEYVASRDNREFLYREVCILELYKK
jgi:hypothetical protein